MKVLHVYKDYYPPVKGGIEKHINILSKGLIKRGVDVRVLVSNTKYKLEEERHENIPVCKAPQVGRFYSAPLTPTFFYHLRRLGKDADILHFHHPNPTAEFSYFFTGLKKKVIVTYHSDIIRQDRLGKIYSPFRKRFLEMADGIIATSPNYIQTSRTLHPFKSKCTVIPLGIDLPRFQSNGDEQKIQQVRAEKKSIPIILFVGCFRYYKGLHVLLSAMEDTDAKLLLIGTGPEEAMLKSMVSGNRKLSEKIEFLGELSDEEVTVYYKACDFFVLPSHLRSEAFGMVQLEAMCCKKSIICADLGTGTTYVNIHNKTGVNVRPNDASSLKNAIQYLIDHPEIRTEYGLCGYSRVKSHFDGEIMVKETLKYYRETLTG